MRLTVVGCSGSFPGPDSPASCYLLEADGFRLVIDMGNGSLGALQRYAGLFDVDAVCLSHLHADHCVDLYSYSVARAYSPAGPQPAIPVYAPAGAAGRIGLIHSADGDEGLMKRFTFVTLTPGELAVGPFDVRLAHVNHPVETFAFRFAHAGRTLVYTGDTGKTEAVPALAAGSDVFLSEAAFLDAPDLPPDLHLTARQAAAYASKADVGRLVLTHLQPWYSADDARTEAATAFAGPLDVASAGQVIDVLEVTAASRPAGPQSECPRVSRWPNRSPARARVISWPA
jgi:ribonuclease BN (tRNA processing enzyme)